tara:strand:- start:245 stop:1165 length:921 start_codon:yes stop_codon:yes gene_type:complete
MADDHAFKMDKLKNNFDSILSLKRKVFQTKTDIHDRLQQVKKMYTELMKQNTKKVMLFCLDAFFFQYKSFMLEIENIEKFRVLLNNRMYCDYYKLYTLIIQYFKDHTIEIENDDLNAKTFPVYKELEPSQEYKLEDVKGIHASILYLINTLHIKSAGQRNTITGYSDDSKIGYSISNFLNTLQYENLILQEQTNLFLNYLAFFHISQKKQLKRVLSKLEDFSNEMDNNLHNNMSFSIDDIEEDNVNQNDYLRDESDEEIDTKEHESEMGSESSKSDTINTIVTQISELNEDKTGAVVQLDDTLNDA